MSEKVRWGILGTAAIARKLVRGVQGSSVAEIAAVASRDGAKARAFADELGIPKAVVGYGELLKDRDIDAIYNPLPNSMHCEWTVRSLQAGKHVLCEKPLAASSGEVRKMAAAAKTSKRLLMEAFMYRFHPQTLRVQELVAGGAIGSLRVIRALFTFQIMDRPSIHSNIRLQKPLAGGALMDVGCYCINLARALAGAEPVRVRGIGNFDTRAGVDVAFSGLLEFPAGVLAHFDCGYNATGDNTAQIVGTKGYIQVPWPWIPDAKRNEIRVTREGKTETVEITDGGDPYRLETDHLSECILRGAQPRLSLEDSLNNMRVIEQCYASARAKA